MLNIRELGCCPPISTSPSIDLETFLIDLNLGFRIPIGHRNVRDTGALSRPLNSCVVFYDFATSVSHGIELDD